MPRAVRRDLSRTASSFAEFARRFLRDHARTTRSDFYAKRVKLLCATFGPRPLAAITRAELDRYVARRLRAVRPSTVRRELAVLRVLFRKAVEWDVLAATPMTGVARVREPPHRTRFLAPEEWRRLAAVAPAWLVPVLEIAVLTGMRLKEIAGLRWEDWDRVAALLHVPVDAKVPTARTVLLSAAATAVLWRVRAAAEAAGSASSAGLAAGNATAAGTAPAASPRAFLFVDERGRPFDDARRRERITKHTITAMRRAGIAGASFHTLRHTAATWMVRAGVPLYEVQRVLGHSTPLMTQRYAALAPDDLRRAVEAAGEVFLGTIRHPRNSVYDEPHRRFPEGS